MELGSYTIISINNMLYNKYTKQLYDSVQDAADNTGLTKENILSLIKDGYYIHFKRCNLAKYIISGKVQLSDIERRRYTS